MLSQKKDEFVQAWGTLGSNWGINKTMAQIHGLLLITSEPMSTEEIMETLSISRGNANMNLRNLLDWGLAYRSSKTGERKDYFTSEKDIWQIMTKVLRERRKRELEPMLHLLKNIDQSSDQSEEEKEFYETIAEIRAFAEQADGILAKVEQTKRSWFFDKMIKVFGNNKGQ